MPVKSRDKQVVLLFENRGCRRESVAADLFRMAGAVVRTGKRIPPLSLRDLSE
jgi:hypothetical protein